MFDSSGFLTEETLISVPEVALRGITGLSVGSLITLVSEFVES